MFFCCCVDDEVCCCVICCSCDRCDKSKINCSRVLYSCSVCILGIILIACSATAFANISSSIEEFNLLIDNW